MSKILNKSKVNLIKVNFERGLQLGGVINKKLMLLIIAMMVTATMSGYKTSSLRDNLYYKNKIKTAQAAKLLKNMKLESSYIVILDSGIDYKYKRQNEGKYVYGTRCVPAWGEYHKNPWTSYQVGINHGTEVQFVCDEIIYDLGINNNEAYSLSQPIMTIQYKISEASGESDVTRLTYAINDIIDHYVLEEKLNIAAINFSSVITFKHEDNEEVKKLKRELEAAINRAASYGITFVTVAGNDNKEITNYSAKLKNVIAVGSTDINNNRALWGEKGGSAFGRELDLVAPGDKLLVFSGDSERVVDSGTSYSAPMVSAAVGLMKGINPKLQPEEIEEILKSTSTDLGEKGRDDYLGYGLLNLERVVETLIKREGSF